MINLSICPVCGSKLQLLNGSYICTNDKCDILVMDNHILTVKMIAELMKEERQSEVKNTKEVIVMNQTKAEEYALKEHDRKSVVVSITSKCSHEAFIVPNKVANIVDVLKVQFNDEDSTDENYGGITYAEAKQIADFVKKYKDNSDIELIIVHCEAGQSRSAGVAGAILKYLYNDDTQIFDDRRYTPNMLCYRRVYESLMYED